MLRPAVFRLGCFSVFCAGLLFGQAPVWAQQPARGESARLTRRLEAVRLTGNITLDGALDEPAWTAAPLATGFIQNDPREGAPATHNTEVRVLYDDTALYFGVVALDTEPARLIVSDLKKDYNPDSSDGFRIILDTFHDERNGYVFAVNPAGAKWDGQISNEGRESNTDWDGIWDVRTQVTKTGWIAEIRIPWRTLRFDNTDPQIWGINFERKIRRLNEDSYWAPVPRIYDVQRVSLAGTLEGLRGLRPGKDLRIKPYALGSTSTIGRKPTKGNFDAGLDVKYGIATGLTWDFTVNTDFSQVEADEQQVNLTRFSLFFPEKRDFFLENSGIFQFGGGGGGGFGGGGAGGGGGGGATSARQQMSQDMRLFFSRRIGLSDSGTEIPILAGTRLTGRLGGYSLGVLNIQQREEGSSPATNFTALRLRRDILSNSDIGAIFLNKDASGAHFNRVAGADANFRFGTSLATYALVAKTFSPVEVVGGSGKDLALRAAARFEDRRWQLAARQEGVGARFNNELGYNQRVGVNNSYLFGGFRMRPSWASRWLREIRPHWQLDMFTRQNGGGLETRTQDYHVPFTFQNSASIETGVNTNVEVIRSPFLLNSARGVRVANGRYVFNEYFVTARTNSADRLSFSNRYSQGDFYGGYRRAYNVGPTFRANEHFNTSLSLQVQDISLPTGDFISTLVTSRVNYNFNTRMFVNALLQYNTDSRQWSSNMRFNVIHRPLSDFFFVYNERRDERSGDLIDRSVVAKMTYLMAF